MALIDFMREDIVSPSEIIKMFELTDVNIDTNKGIYTGRLPSGKICFWNMLTRECGYVDKKEYIGMFGLGGKFDGNTVYAREVVDVV